MGLRYRIPCIAVELLPFGIGSDRFPQLLFFLLLAGHQRRIFESCKLSAINLQSILHAVQLVLRLPCLFFTERHVFLKHCFTPFQQTKDDRNTRVAQFVQVSDCIETRSRTRITGHENEIAFLCPGGGPLEVVLGMDRLVVFINANQRHVDVVTRKVEIVGIATEECGLEFRHKDEANVCVLFIAIKTVLTALVKRDNVRTQAGRFQRLSFDLRDLDSFRLERVGVAGVWLYCSVYTRSHVFDAYQLVQLKTGRLDLVGARFCQKSFFGQVLLGRAHLVNDVFDDVIVRQNEAVWRDKRARAAVVEPDGGEPDLVQPLIRNLKTIFLLDFSARDVVERPHAFVGERG